jgi:hypothetical protein
MRKYHPDTSTDSQSAERAKEINEAYEVLSSPSRRKGYDATRRSASSARNTTSERGSTPPPPPPPSYAIQPHERTAAKIRRYDLLALAVAAGFGILLLFEVFGQANSEQGTPVGLETDSSATSSAVPKAPASSPTSTASPKPDPQPVLAQLEDSDWLRIGMGCSCSFSVGGASQPNIIAGGGLAFFRMNGNEHLCQAPDAQALFKGPVSISCPSTVVKLRPFGEVEPGFDGHSSKALLAITGSDGDLTLDGTWDCYC